MLKALILILLGSVSAQAAQSSFESEVVKIDYASHPGEEHLVYFLNEGRVGFLKATHFSELEQLKKRLQNHERVKVTMNQDHRILYLSAPKILKEEVQDEGIKNTWDETYDPTVIDDLKAAAEIMNQMNPRSRTRSQCYNRAEIWTYELKKKRNVDSMKVFLFFTSRYIREYDYHWWFHVSPYLLVNENGTIQERVIDHEFTNRPLLMKPWTDKFVRAHENCPVAAKYTDYSQNQWAHYCYVMKAPMYYWQPRDLEQLELSGKTKTQFLPDEISSAYSQGFRGPWIWPVLQ